ncbi:hypothetical protein BD626DRAFT_504638 [Schizophyllum amplum]|uniref:SNF5-domain-containing protein n=1 Tax=Schizophyllum amplum TaxID=97359 RepID=A0A550C740_9AGAR|nr:hypothetical protein BD626DRAFT_504638 [Auriculariopsis ampla]
MSGYTAARYPGMAETQMQQSGQAAYAQPVATAPPPRGGHRGGRLTVQPSATPIPPPPPPHTVSYPPPPAGVLPTTPQALTSDYASRMQTGITLLMQPIFNNNAIASANPTTTTRSSRRGAAISYVDPGSDVDDDLLDAGAIDTDDDDFVASGGVRTSVRAARQRFPGVSTSSGARAYLGQPPPARFLRPRYINQQAAMRSSLVPIRVEFETPTHRIRDCFTWNLREQILTPEAFGEIFCHDLDLNPDAWRGTIAAQIRAQLEEWEGVASMDLGGDAAEDGGEEAECRVILSIDVQINHHHLNDHIEWDLLSPLTPEAFARALCADLGLGGEAVALVAHAVQEEIVKHKRDAIEWGILPPATGGPEEYVYDRGAMLKDKRALGGQRKLAPELKSVWRDWADAEEWRTRYEELSLEEIERREGERERASRRLRRETSKFQTANRRSRR